MTAAQAAVMGTAWLTAYRMLFVKSGLRAGADDARPGRVRRRVDGADPARPGGRHAGVGHRPQRREARAGREAGRARHVRLGRAAAERVDAVFETVGDATWAHSMRALKPGGVIVVSGPTSGPNPGADLQRLFFLQLGSSARRWAPGTSSRTC